MIARTVKARMRAWSALYVPEKFMTPSGSVHWYSPLSRISGRRNAFQVLTIARTLTVASAGRASGSRTRQKNPNVLQPSILAASSSSAGMLLKNGRRMMIVRGSPKAASGSATPRKFPDSPRSADQDVQRQDRDGRREEQPEHEQRVDRLPAAEHDPGEDERGQ